MPKHTSKPWVINHSDLTIRAKEWNRCPMIGDYQGCIITDCKPALGLTEEDIRERGIPEFRKAAYKETIRNMYLMSAAPEMYEALKEVEWAPSEFDGELYCPWCGDMKRMGHSDNCLRQMALKKAWCK